MTGPGDALRPLTEGGFDPRGSRERRNPTSTSDTSTVAVTGAGITGITTAYNLARRGCRVTIFDRHTYAAMETSFARC